MKQLILLGLYILCIQAYTLAQTNCGDITAQDIEETETKIGDIKLIDLGGRTIFHQRDIDRSSIDMSKIQSGFYLLEMFDNKRNRIHIEKIVRM